MPVGKDEKWQIWLAERQYWIRCVLYPESQQAAIDYIIANVPCAWILHDQDLNADGTQMKPHIHFLIHFDNARKPSAFLKKLPDVPEGALRSVDFPSEAQKYLTHESSKCEGKTIYPADAVHWENGYLPAGVGKVNLEDKAAEEMFNLMGFAQSWSHFCRLCCEQGYWSQLRRASYLWHSLWRDKQFGTGCGSGVQADVPQPGGAGECGI